MDLNEDGFYSRLYKAFEKGLNSKLKTRPKVDKKIIKISHDDQIHMRERYDHLKTWRIKISKKLNLAPSIIWPLASLNRLAKKSHQLELELSDISIKNWQKEMFSKDLDKFLTSLINIQL